MWATVTPENINIWFVAAEIDVGFMAKGEFGSRLSGGVRGGFGIILGRLGIFGGTFV